MIPSKKLFTVIKVEEIEASGLEGLKLIEFLPLTSVVKRSVSDRV